MRAVADPSQQARRRSYWLKTLHQWHWISAALCLVGMILFAATGITDGLLFDGVKFEKDCTRTSSLVISTLDNTARFTTTVHIKDGAQSIALR